jgi:RecA-family ATPase
MIKRDREALHAKFKQAEQEHGPDKDAFASRHTNGNDWLSWDIPEADNLLGELFSTTSRIMMIAPTGKGKTHVGMALAYAMAAGKDFLHWNGRGKPARVLYIDGEMSKRLMKRRLKDLARRNGDANKLPDGLFILSRAEWEQMQPLDTEAGHNG